MKYFTSEGVFKALNDEEVKGLNSDELISYMEAKKVSEDKAKQSDNDALKAEFKSLKEVSEAKELS